MTFELIPAIDLLDGACVRLSQGRYEDATVYDRDPAAMAARFARHAIRRLHVVDLDGAREGRPVNSDAVRGIVAAVGDIPVQLGGGLRDVPAVESALATGVDRVVLGTVALRDPALVREAAKRYCLLGRAEDCLDQMQRFVAAGARQFILVPLMDHTSLIEIAQAKILPEIPNLQPSSTGSTSG